MSGNTVTERVVGDVPLRDAADVAAEIPDDGVVLVSGFGSVGYPKAVPDALRTSGRDLALTLVSGGSVGDEIDVDLMEAGAIARRFPYQARPPARERVNSREVAFHDRHIAALGDEVRYGSLVDADVAVVEAVAVGEDWFVPSMCIGPTPSFVDAADRLVVEVNDAQPLALQQFHDVYRPGVEPLPLADPADRIGSPRVEFDPEKLVGVVRTDRPDRPYTFRDLTAAEQDLAVHLAEFLSEEIDRNPAYEERVPLQFGVGSIGNALMSELGGVDFGGREALYAGEVIQDGLLDMLDRDLLTSASATSLALSSEGQRQLVENVDRYAEDVVLRPSDVSNDPSSVKRFRTIGVNSAVEVDIYGHANSTHLNGTHAVNGVGGSGDFIRNALVSVVALPSTAAGGDISRIVPMASHVDHTEHDIDVVVTEHGVADLRGLVPVERAEVIVESCAHPSHRPELRSYLDDALERDGHIPHDLGAAFDRHVDRR
jgi:succinyl-CoA:acetate CoA-transferase